MPFRLYVGTASWTDPTLLACGRFYPVQARTSEARLRYYASRFPMVEVASSYYRLPDPAVAYRWAQGTPPGFTFNVKAFRLFTGHQTPLTALPADIRSELGEDRAVIFDNHLPSELSDELWRRFLLALEPLRMSGKLGAVHFQFPPWVRRDKRGAARAAQCAQHMAGFLASVEFRHRSWFADPLATASTLAMERELGLVHTVVDAPQGADNTVPAVWETTHPDLALVRLHGRNARTWNAASGASSGRFNYEYSRQELAELADRVQRIAEQARRTQAVFNTNFEDQGMRNAAGLAAAFAPV